MAFASKQALIDTRDGRTVTVLPWPRKRDARAARERLTRLGLYPVRYADGDARIVEAESLVDVSLST